MGRTPGHPWIGESVVLDWANVISGSPFSDFGDAIRYRVRDDGTSTLTAGDSFLAGFYDSQSMLSGDDVTAAAVLEVTSGSGTVRLSAGTDPAWSLSDPGTASTVLGTFTVSGAGQVVGEFPSFDVDAYLSEAAETVVYVECLTGTVVLNQVKLRLWPPGGAVGGWVPAAGFDVSAATSAKAVGSVILAAADSLVTGGDPAALFATAADSLVDAAAADLTVGTSGVTGTIAAYADANVSVAEKPLDPGIYNASSGADIGATVVRQADPVNVARVNTPAAVGEWGTEVAWPPDEVPGDFGVDLLGDPTVSWGSAVWTVGEFTPDPDGSGGAAGIVATAVPDTAFDDPATLDPPVSGGVTVGAPASSGALAMPSGSRTALVSMTHPFLTSAPTAGGSNWSVGAYTSATVALDLSTVTVPAYRYWSPTAQPEQPLKLITRRDSLGMGPGALLGADTRQGSIRLLASP